MKFWAKFIKILLKNDKILKIFAKFFEKMQKKITKFFAENLRSERCKGMQIL